MRERGREGERGMEFVAYYEVRRGGGRERGSRWEKIMWLVSVRWVSEGKRGSHLDGLVNGFVIVR